MKLKRWSIFVVLLSLLVSMVTGCQPQFQPGAFTDDMGRAVIIDQIPERILSFGPSITEILFALGLEEKVVGVTDFCDYPEAAQLKPKVGSAFNPSLENIIELEPDLVLTVEHQQLNNQLDAQGIKFLVVDPKDIDGIFRDIELVGEITGAEGRAEQLVEDIQDNISQVTALMKDVLKVSVFFIVDATDLNSPWTAGPGSFIDALITMAGGENIASKAPSEWVQFSLEQIVSSDAGAIIIQTMTGGEPTVSKEALEEHPSWGQMAAVKEGKISFINGDLVSRPGPRIVQGLEEMARLLHPEMFK